MDTLVNKNKFTPPCKMSGVSHHVASDGQCTYSTKPFQPLRAHIVLKLRGLNREPICTVLAPLGSVVMSGGRREIIMILQLRCCEEK